jgi:hypothetical protein
MSHKPDNPQAFDPFGAWQSMHEAGVEAWV